MAAAKRVTGLLLVVATACTSPQTSETETNADSVAILSGDGVDVGLSVDSDTVFVPLNLVGAFNDPQIDPAAGYVYEGAGVDIYESIDSSHVIGYIPYAAKVKITESEDKKFIGIEYGGKVGFALRDAILPFPVPETKDVAEYFTKTLMLTKDPVEKKSVSENAEDAPFSFTNYYFENGIKIEKGNEGSRGFTRVILPGFSVHQAFLLASVFYESFENSFQTFPADVRDEDINEQRHATVELYGETEVTRIMVGTRDGGCYSEDSVEATADGSIMQISGGC